MTERPRTKVDFWAWRTRECPEKLQNALQGLFSAPSVPVTLSARKSGWNGYERAADVMLGTMAVGMVADGGESQRGWTYVGIPGRGCEWVADWDRAQEAAAGCDHYELKRVDLAHDVSNPDAFEQVIAAHRAGEFTTRGRPPSMRKIDTESDADGRTIYVGARSEAKFYRGYEKGKELMGPELAKARCRPDFDWLDYVMASWQRVDDDGQLVIDRMWHWWRHELELKAKGAPLPEDLIDRRDEYFAGAYPYLGTVLQGVEPTILQMPRDRGPRLDLALALANVRRQYGSTLFTALTAFHGDIGAVWDRIVGRRHNDALVRAGVLMVDHFGDEG